MAGSQILQIAFFSFSVVVIMNGNNLIDGANGLMPMSSIFQCLSLLFLCIISGDLINMSRVLLILIPLLIFLIFNYPLGKIFMGDFGAYFIGFLVANMCIIFFAEHPEINTWNAVLILFYPAFELLFSIVRKVSQNYDPTLPDPNHLHLKLFHCLNKSITNNLIVNNLIMPSLCAVWGVQFVFVCLFYSSLSIILLAIFINAIIYLGFYTSLPRVKNTAL